MIGKQIKQHNLTGNWMMVITTLLVFSSSCIAKKKESTPRPNVLIIIADDLNYDSPGYSDGGGVAPDITPNLDKFAAESFRFKKAFTTVSVCQPSRQSMLSGKYPHNYGGRGFFPMAAGTETLPLILKREGYVTGNVHKPHHLEPYESFDFDYLSKDLLGYKVPDGVIGRDPEKMALCLSKLIDIADKEEKPFFMIMNSADPHRPFHGDKFETKIPYWGDGKVEIVLPDPSRIYTADEVILPPTLPDVPGIRKDLAKYASSVRRLDDAVGSCLKVIDDKGKKTSTMVIFVSDNGMPLPYAKFDAYLGSNKSPLLIRWPEGIKNIETNEKDLISLMDITPTVLEYASVDVPKGLDGKSLVPFLSNDAPKKWREGIVFLRNEDIYYGDGLANVLKKNSNFTKALEKVGWVKRPDHHVPGTFSRDKEIRTYFDGKFGYVFNGCFVENGYDVSVRGAIVPYNDPSLNAMRLASEKDRKIKKQYDTYILRAREELYDWSEDLGSQTNLADDPKYKEQLEKSRKGMLKWLKSSDDPLLVKYKETLGL